MVPSAFVTRRPVVSARRAWPLAAALIVLVSVVWGWRVQSDVNVKLGAAPLVGEWRARFGPSLLVAAAVAAAVAFWGSAAASRLRFRTLMVLASLVAVVFTFALAASDGLAHVLDPVVHRTEYWANLATLPDAGTMLRKYGSLEFLLNFSVHAKGHPPAFFLVLKALAAIGLGNPWVTGALSYLGVAIVVAAVLATVRIVATEQVARQVAPFLVVAPYAVWMGTSADALYAAVAAVGVLLTAWAAQASATAPANRRQDFGAVAAGAMLGLLLFFTYGGAVFGLVAITVAVGMLWGQWAIMARVAAAGAIGVAVVIAAFALAGFWWFDGAQVTRTLYWAGTAQFRPAGYFAIGNLGATLIAVGPAVVFGLGRLQSRRLWLIVAAGAVGVLVADASQYSKAEVERIWLIFFPWLVPAASCLPHPRRWIGVQGAVAIGLQFFLVSKW